MSSAGQRLVAGRIPGEEIALTTNTSDSSTWTTTETETDSVTAPLVSGRTYKIRWSGAIVTTVAGDVDLLRIREDNTTGTALQTRGLYLGSTISGGIPCTLEARYTAVATADKTFVVTGIRNAGTGTHHGDGDPTRPRHTYVEYVSG